MQLASSVSKGKIRVRIQQGFRLLVFSPYVRPSVRPRNRCSDDSYPLKILAIFIITKYIFSSRRRSIRTRHGLFRKWVAPGRQLANKETKREHQKEEEEEE